MVEILAFRLFSELSTLDEEFDNERLDVWLVEILTLTILSELSTLDDEFESERLEV